MGEGVDCGCIFFGGVDQFFVQGVEDVVVGGQDFDVFGLGLFDYCCCCGIDDGGDIVGLGIKEGIVVYVFICLGEGILQGYYLDVVKWCYCGVVILDCLGCEFFLFLICWSQVNVIGFVGIVWFG